jgi:2-C-methyl-D-erythritol 4-phosphate cytidylyltransferase/2-C-methyl-D-erythritol 2,4-cyclodiphosphate synthase
MKTVAAILAAGRSERFGSDKTEALLGGRPVWRWSLDTYLAHPQVDRVILVTTEAKAALIAAQVGEEVKVVLGGASRQESSCAALSAALDAEILLVHDAARPFVSPDLISRTIAAVYRSGAAAAALRVTDTIKEVGNGRVKTLDRASLVAMQTPQGALVELLRRAHDAATSDLTDEMALVEALGVHPEIVEGEPDNFKITTPEDLTRARAHLGRSETRVGIGYDIHPFSDDPSRGLYLGGIHFPDHRALDGHSDADVVLHAATDALLGAAGLGDIGQHFPNTDPRWRGEPSLTFLRHAALLLREEGWRIVNLDITAIAESPKIMKKAIEIRSAIAAALEVEVSRISIKATTNERLGSIGRSEGIAAFATASIATEI